MNKCLLVVLLGLGGCATNPYRQYFTAVPSDGAPSRIDASFSGDPMLYSSKHEEIETDANRLREDNYIALGFSLFNATNDVTESQLKEYAREIKASLVVLYIKYAGTVSGVTQRVLPDIQTTYSNTSGTAYASGSIYNGTTQANYYGSEGYNQNTLKTSYGVKTAYVPYSSNRYDYLATFWANGKPRVFGATVENLSPEIRAEIGSNKGVRIHAVQHKSPAYYADILANDIIRKMDGAEVYDSDSFIKILTEKAGQNIKIDLLRNNEPIVKDVKLNPL